MNREARLLAFLDDVFGIKLKAQFWKVEQEFEEQTKNQYRVVCFTPDSCLWARMVETGRW